MKELLTTCIKAYQDAIEFVREEYDKDIIHAYLAQNDLLYGLCSFVNETFDKEPAEAFEDKYIGIEKAILFAWQSPNDYIRESGKEFSSQILIEKCLKPRFNFLVDKLGEL